MYAGILQNPAYNIDNIFENMSVIKPDLGKVTNISDLSSDITVINIQDLHCHKQTQLNISKIIKEINTKFALKAIYVEGGYGNIDVSWINQIKNAGFKNKIVEKLLEDGYLSASEYFAIKNNKYNLLKGLEQQDIHTENLKRLSTVIENQPRYKETLLNIKKELKILNAQYVNSRNERFTKYIDSYFNGKTDSTKFYTLLFKYINKISQNPQNYNNITAIQIEDYPNISMYLGLSKRYRGLNINQVNTELEAFIGTLKNKLSYSVYKKLLESTNSFRDTERLFEFLSKLPKEITFNLSEDYSQLDKFFAIRRMNQRINPINLVEEERKLTEQIRMALSKNSTEQEIAYITDFSKYFKDYLTYSLTASDWKYFKYGFQKFYGIYAKYAVIDRIKSLDNDIKELNKYYEINNERNLIFISNILKEETPLTITTNAKVRTIEEILKQSKKVKIVVTGGYHSEELSKILNDKNINTIVITPNVKDKVEQANKKYNEIVKEQNKIKSQALAFRLASCSTEKDQRVLLAKVAMDLLGTMDVNQAKQKLQEYGLNVEDINLTQEDIKNQKQQTDSQITKIGSLIGKIINLMVTPEMMLNPRETIDTALIAMFEILVIQGIYFSKGFSPFIEEAGFIKKQTLFKNFDAVILSRLPVTIQQGISDTNTPNRMKKKSKLSKIEKTLRKDLKDIAAEMRKKAERNRAIKRPTLLDKIIFELISSKYQMESISQQLKGIESVIAIQKADIENIEIEPIQQITDIKQQEKAINDTVKQLEIFEPKLEAISQLEITIEEIKLQIEILQSKSFDQKTKDQLKVTLDRLENAEQNFNLLVNTFLNSLTKVYTDENTRQHAMKVAQYTQAITRYIPADLKKDYAPHFEYYSIIAALLHDIGKNAIPDSVLNKQGNLDDNEFEMIKTHAALGAEILNLSGFKIFAFGAQYHQEKYNGQGYPNQLEDGQIPFIATIIALADSYDAMISKRIYKEELYRYIAIGRIKHDEGIYFNPIVVESFMKAVNNGEFTPLRKGEIDYLLEASVDNSNVEILPENFEIVKESIQKGQGLWETAFRVAIKEIPNTLSTKSKDKRTIETAKPRLRDISNILKNWLLLTWRTPKLSEKLGEILKKIIAIERITIKHVIVDYKYVKATGLQETIKKFGNNVTVDEKGQVHIPPILIVEDIEEIPAEERRNTGLKIKGKTIWQVETKGILVYGAKGALLEDISKTLGIDIIKEELEKNFRKEGHKINLVVDTIMASNTQEDRIVFEKNITTLKAEEIQKRNSQEQEEYIGSVLEIRSAIAVSQGEKIIISLEKIEDKELLLQKIKNGKSRKIITVGQYEKLKSKNENIDREFMDLRKEGIDIYVQFSDEQKNRDYRQKGFSGYIVGNKLTDYYSGDTINIKLIDNSETVTLKYLEEMMTSSQEPLVVNIDILEKVFKQNRDILDSYDMLNLLIGSIETTFKIGDLSPLDAKEMVYNMNFAKIPEISKEKRQELANLTDEELSDMYNIKSILELSGSDVISVTMQELENAEETKRIFMKTIRERILAKSMLQENNKNYGLKDKELEILLGKSIVEQFKNNDKITTNIPAEFIGNEANMMMFINKLQSDIEIINADLTTESDETKTAELQQQKVVATNTTIELILVFADDNKFKTITKVESANDAKNYRSMLSAA